MARPAGLVGSRASGDELAEGLEQVVLAPVDQRDIDRLAPSHLAAGSHPTLHNDHDPMT